MDAYLEIRLLPDPEFPVSFLMGALYGKLHRALVTLDSSQIGVSFPGYSQSPRSMGDRLRLHGTQAALSQLMRQSWLKGMSDHIQSSDILPIPESVQYRTISRRQFKTSSERLRRRRMKRKGETWEQAAAAIPDTAEHKPDLPYIHLRSKSTEQSFTLFIEQGELKGQPTHAEFNTYGLSRQATIPWF